MNEILHACVVLKLRPKNEMERTGISKKEKGKRSEIHANCPQTTQHHI